MFLPQEGGCLKIHPLPAPPLQALWVRWGREP